MEVKPLKIRDEEHHSTVGQDKVNPWLHQDPERRQLKSPGPGNCEGPPGASSQLPKVCNIHFSLQGRMGGSLEPRVAGWAPPSPPQWFLASVLMTA